MIHGGTHADIDELMEDVQYDVYACANSRRPKSTPVVVRSSSQPRKPGSSKTAELTRPLKDVSVSGLTLEILKNVNGLTRDASLASPGFCGKGQTVPVGDGGPVMRISEALVGLRCCPTVPRIGCWPTPTSWRMPVEPGCAAVGLGWLQLLRPPTRHRGWENHHGRRGEGGFGIPRRRREDGLGSPTLLT